MRRLHEDVRLLVHLSLLSAPRRRYLWPTETPNESTLTRQYLEDVMKSRIRDEFVTYRNSVERLGVQSETDVFMEVKKLPTKDQKRILVTGGAGFVGSHLVDRLMKDGHLVTVIDNFFTGRKKNVMHWIGHPNFMIIDHDVVEPFMIEVDQIYNLACPASPPHYQYNPIKTIKTSVMGTLNMLGLAKRVKARILLTSTSEVYGDPKVHPQVETYWGNVNPIGPRACYDEGKRVAETMMYSYEAQEDVEIRVARIFNTFGPRMHPNDGRVVSNFIIQALRGQDITIYGNGAQTRSFQYVSDLVNGLVALMNSDYSKPVNIGNPDEYSIKDFALLIKELTNSQSDIVHLPAGRDDPSKRKPDISLAKVRSTFRVCGHLAELLYLAHDRNMFIAARSRLDTQGGRIARSAPDCGVFSKGAYGDGRVGSPRSSANRMTGVIDFDATVVRETPFFLLFLADGLFSLPHTQKKCLGKTPPPFRPCSSVPFTPSFRRRRSPCRYLRTDQSFPSMTSIVSYVYIRTLVISP